MAPVNGIERYSRCGLMLRQFLLVVEMMGVEACGALEILLMIANIQTLGVPIRYSCLPGTISSVLGVVLIPGVGLLIDKKAKSKSAKAKVLICTSSLQLIGALLIFVANSVKLIYHDDVPVDNNSTSWAWMTAAQDNPNSSTSTPHLLTNPQAANLFTGSVWDNVTALATTSQPIVLDFNTNSTESSVVVVNSEGEGSIQYYAILAMIGYCLLDLGYDSSNCFLKTFALASTAPKDQSSIIVKSILVSSFGGCFIAVIGSLGLGDVLTAGTSHDSNAAQCAFISALTFALLLSTLITSVSTGFCCPPSGYTVLEAAPSNDSIFNDKSRLILSGEAPRDMTTSQQQAWLLSHDSSRNFMEKTLSGHSCPRVLVSNELCDKRERNGVIDQAELSTNRSWLVRFVISRKKQIIINMATFFFLGAMYSFGMFAVNFVGEGFFNGDPLADVDSDDYKNYVKGIKTGSMGTLTYYVTFTVMNAFQEILLDRVGWKLEILVVSALYVVTMLVCALTATLWSFYLCFVLTGIFRTVVVSVPYILANQLALEQGDGKDSGVAMATVAAMLPLGYTVCSAVMGPLIDVTGNAAIPIYYTVVSAFLGTITIAFLKID